MAATVAAVGPWTQSTKFDYDELNKSGVTEDGGMRQYTFVEESGDIGEADPELEESLFGTKARAGDAMKALELDVTLESATKFKPVRSVSPVPLKAPPTTNQFPV